MDLLRFLTAGSVDDGKSTLIGRLLFDSESVSTDILQAIEKASKGKHATEIDLSLLTDGLRAEREQGITIDVAYKYFITEKRKFIIADTPGHVQYTRNMVTGASNSNLAIILIDARNGITEQTCRHSIIASLFGIQHLVVCVNKIDLMNYSEKVFNDIVANYRDFSKTLFVNDITFIPVSAKFGDNVVTKSEKMPWYIGKPLLLHLETVELASDFNFSLARFPVQYVIRPRQDALHDYRGYAGKVVSGVFKKGDEVKVFPAGLTSRIKEIEIEEKEISEAFAPQSVVIHLEEDIDISRGDVIAKKDDSLLVTQDVEATVCWMSERPVQPGARLAIKHTSRWARAVLDEIVAVVDMDSLDERPSTGELVLNDIARVRLRLSEPLLVDPYGESRITGAFILTDEATNDTVAAGMVISATA